MSDRFPIKKCPMCGLEMSPEQTECAEVVEICRRTDLTTSVRARHVFVPTGSIWLGCFAAITIILSFVIRATDWGHIQVEDFGELHHVDPIMVTLQSSSGNMSGGGLPYGLFLTVIPTTLIGMLLAVTSMFIPQRSWKLTMIGLSLNIVFFTLGYLGA